MHSVKLSRVTKWILLSAALVMSAPVFAEDPQTGTPAQVKLQGLKDQQTSLMTAIQAASGKSQKDLIKQKGALDQQIKAAQVELDNEAKATAKNLADRQAAIAKVQSDQAQIAANKSTIDANTASMTADKSKSDLQKIRRQNDDLKKKNDALSADITAQGATYIRLAGTQMPQDPDTGSADAASAGAVSSGTVSPGASAANGVSTGDGQTPLPGAAAANTVAASTNLKDRELPTGATATAPAGSAGQPTVPGPQSTNAELKTNEACWTKNDAPAKTPVYAYFPIGKSQLRKASAGVSEEEVRLHTLFTDNAVSAINDLNENKDHRISKIEATGYCSTIPMHSKTLETLADERGKYAANNFFSTAMIETGAANLTIPGYETKGNPGSPPVVGPVWTPGDYAELLKTKPTDADITKAADAIMASKDFTPVKGATRAETKKRLLECCNTNKATLKYQPYQYIELHIYGSKFDVNLPGCKNPTVSDLPAKPNDLGIPNNLGIPANPTQGNPIQGKGGKDKSGAGI